MAERICKQCQETIKARARVCPHCRSRQGWSIGAKLLVSGICLFVLAPLLMDSTPTQPTLRPGTQVMASTPTPPSHRPSVVPSPAPAEKKYLVQVIARAPGSNRSVKLFQHGFGRDHEEVPLGSIPKGTQLTAVAWKCGDGGRFRTGPATPYFRVHYSGESGWLNTRTTEEGDVGLLKPSECYEFFASRFPGLPKGR